MTWWQFGLAYLCALPFLAIIVMAFMAAVPRDEDE